MAAGYVVLHHDARIQTLVALPFFFGLPRLPAWALLGVWLALAIVLAAAHAITPPGGGPGLVAVALAGGLAFGLLAVGVFARGRQQLSEATAGA